MPRALKGQHLAQGHVTNPGELSVPFVTSPLKGHVQNCVSEWHKSLVSRGLLDGLEISDWNLLKKKKKRNRQGHLSWASLQLLWTLTGVLLCSTLTHVHDWRTVTHGGQLCCYFCGTVWLCTFAICERSAASHSRTQTGQTVTGPASNLWRALAVDDRGLAAVHPRSRNRRCRVCANVLPESQGRIRQEVQTQSISVGFWLCSSWVFVRWHERDTIDLELCKAWGTSFLCNLVRFCFVFLPFSCSLTYKKKNIACSHYCHFICGDGWSENNLKLQHARVLDSRAPPRELVQHRDSLFPRKQPAFFSQRELAALCARPAAAFRFRSPRRGFTKGPRNAINLRGRAAEFGWAQPLSSASGIRCHLTKAASNYIFLSRLLYPHWFLSLLAVYSACNHLQCRIKCNVCAPQFQRNKAYWLSIGWIKDPTFELVQ